MCAASTIILSCDNANKRNSNNGTQNDNLPTTNPHNPPMADSADDNRDAQMSSNRNSGDMSQIYSQLNLSEEQETRLEALEEKYDSRMNASTDQQTTATNTTTDNQNTMEEKEREIRNILTAEQFEKYQQMKNDSSR